MFAECLGYMEEDYRDMRVKEKKIDFIFHMQNK